MSLQDGVMFAALLLVCVILATLISVYSEHDGE